MNWSQISGAADRVVIALLSYFVAKGYLLSADVEPIASALITGLGAAYAIYINRNTNLAKQAASIPDTTVVTSPDIATATPNQPNIVSNTANKVINS